MACSPGWPGYLMRGSSTKGIPACTDPFGQRLKCIPGEQGAEVGHRHGNAFDQPRVLGRCGAAGVVGRDLIAEEIEVHPTVSAAAFPAAQDLAIEPAGRGQIAHEEGEVEGLSHPGKHEANTHVPQLRNCS